MEDWPESFAGSAEEFSLTISGGSGVCSRSEGSLLELVGKYVTRSLHGRAFRGAHETAVPICLAPLAGAVSEEPRLN